MNTITGRNRRKRMFLCLIPILLVPLLAFTSYGQIAFTNLHVFTVYDENGILPMAGLVESRSGELYGTTAGVRMNGAGRRIRPTIFKITPEGEFHVLSWLGPTNDDWITTKSGNPSVVRLKVPDEMLTSSLVQSTKGDFYGVAERGGEFGYGRVFKMNPAGKVTTLHSFDGYHGTNGWGPMGGLTEGKDGWFYGTAYNGGMGTVNKINTDGSLKTLFYFNGTNGAFPASSLTQGKDGCFYGTTPYGGPAYAKGPPELGSGTVFKITTNGTLTTLFSFNGTNGPMPYAGLTQGNDGNLYGTTKFGGAGYGTVFRILPSGRFTTLFSFNGTNGARPKGLLVQGRDGYLYGTTEFGGTGYRGANEGIEHLFNKTFGTIFRFSTNGDFTSLLSFSGTNGSHPNGGLLQAKNRAFYGTTRSGGTRFDGEHEFGSGTVFRFEIASPPASGK